MMTLQTRQICLALGIFLAAVSARARVFDINSEKVSGYFSAGIGPSSAGKMAFENEANTTTTYDKKADYNYSGEFGFMYSQPAVSFRFGFEILKPQTLTDVMATNGGTNTYSLQSAYTGYAPKFGIEANVHSTQDYRTFIQAFIGSANISIKNDYTIVSYPGVVNHSVEAKGTGSVYGGSLGVESHLTDNTTYVFEFGYRVLTIEEFSYSKAATTFSGNKAAGDPFVDVNGKARSLNMTGGYMSLGFRIYL
jgi:hypothetical protein